MKVRTEDGQNFPTKAKAAKATSTRRRGRWKRQWDRESPVLRRRIPVGEVLKMHSKARQPLPPALIAREGPVAGRCEGKKKRGSAGRAGMGWGLGVGLCRGGGVGWGYSGPPNANARVRFAFHHLDWALARAPRCRFPLPCCEALALPLAVCVGGGYGLLPVELVSGINAVPTNEVRPLGQIGAHGSCWELRARVLLAVLLRATCYCEAVPIRS
jgi:hypothetical protein